ncbi:MAG: polysaccharide biosynthesis protein [Fodinibius sp.]|nr:polysaccharide biosynthesis protein [Fodinibius sp.]
MTRFNISLQDGVDLVMYALKNAWGGEAVRSQIPCYRITDLAEAIGPNCEHPEVGIRPGEKIHEEMITASDSFNTYDLGKYYAILPTQPIWDKQEFIEHFDAEPVETGFTYSSGDNDEWETVESLRKKIKKYVDPSFSVNKKVK